MDNITIRFCAFNDLFTIFRCNELVENRTFLRHIVFGRVCYGFCATKEWKRILEFPKTYESYAILILLLEKAICEKETNLVYKLMEALTLHHANKLEPNIIGKILHFLAEQKFQTQKCVGKILQILQENERIITEPVAETLINVLKRSNHNNDAKRIQMDFS